VAEGAAPETGTQGVRCFGLPTTIETGRDGPNGG
jgi:hypothetical protein